MTTGDFFKELAKESGSLDEDTVKRVYNGMLSLIYKELRTRGAVRLPALCDVYLIKVGQRVIHSWRMKTSLYKPEHHEVHLRLLHTVKKYFKALEESNPDAVLDPGERLERLDVDGTLREKRLKLMDKKFGRPTK